MAVTATQHMLPLPKIVFLLVLGTLFGCTFAALELFPEAARQRAAATRPHPKPVPPHNIEA